MTYRIGTRGSKLAMIQATSVRDRLAAAYPEDTFEIVPIVTKGDRVTDRPLAAIGGSGVFVREIERALLAGEIDLAVHSMKDLPAEQPEGLCLAKAWSRDDPRDALVVAPRRSRSDRPTTPRNPFHGQDALRALPPGATVATGSARRAHFLRARRPDLNLVDIRGNVDTRLRKLFDPQPGEPHLDAIVLAAAGLRRLGRADVITEYLDPTWMIPAPNQGQLAIELRATCGDEGVPAPRASQSESEGDHVCGGDEGVPAPRASQSESEGDHVLGGDEGVPAPRASQSESEGDYAWGGGALAPASAARHLKAMVDALGDDRAEAAAQAERAFLRSTGATCHEAVAAYAHYENGELKLESFYER